MGNEQWKQTDDYAYYDHTTVTKVKEQLRAGRVLAKSQETIQGRSSRDAVDKLRGLVEACVKNNFVGVENSKLYSETYYGTKRLAQDFIDELHSALQYLLQSSQLSQSEKYSLAKHLHTNFGRTAFCEFFWNSRLLFEPYSGLEKSWKCSLFICVPRLAIPPETSMTDSEIIIQVSQEGRRLHVRFSRLIYSRK